MKRYDYVVLTQDWHPKGHSSFAISHEGKNPLDVVKMPYGDQVLWPEHCIQGSKGAEFHCKLDTDRASAIIRKGSNTLIDSYSAFFENDRRTTTGLDGYFKTLGIEEIYLVGLATDFCVNYSAQDAAKLGYKVSVFELARGLVGNSGVSTENGAIYWSLFDTTCCQQNQLLGSVYWSRRWTHRSQISR